MSRFGTLGTQFFNGSGDPLVDGLINFYQSGTTTRKTTYADASLTIPNSNPVVLTGAGRLNHDVYFEGVCDATLTTASGVVIESRTNIGGESTTAFGDWTVAAFYGAGDIVIGSDGGYYSSLIGGNQGNDPTASGSESYWEQIKPPRVWNPNITYAVDDIVQGTDGYLYTSVAAANVNNNPITDDGSKWVGSVNPYSTGDVVFTADSTKYLTPGWISCDGAAFLSTTYPLLATMLGAWYSKLADPATLPAGTMTSFGGSIPWTTDDIYVAVPHATTPFVTIYKRTGDTFTKLSNPATLPTGTGNGADFDGTDTYLAVGHNTTPFVTIYSRSGDVFTKLANPATLPTGSGRGIKFDSTTAHLAVGHNTSPFITVYAITAGPTFTKLANPATLPSDTVNAVAWTSDSSYLALACSTISVLVIYSLSGSTLTKVADPTTLPSANGVGVSFDSTDTYLAFASTSSPYLLVYKNSAGTFEKLPNSNFSDLPSSSLRDVYFDSDGFLFCVTDNAIIRYKRDGDTFTQIGSEFVTSDDVGTNVTVSKSGTKAYSSIGGTVSPFVAFYKQDTYITPNIDADSNNIVKAYIKTGA